MVLSRSFLDWLMRRRVQVVTTYGIFLLVVREGLNGKKNTR